jgi:hypothetical protein
MAEPSATSLFVSCFEQEFNPAIENVNKNTNNNLFINAPKREKNGFLTIYLPIKTNYLSIDINLLKPTIPT